MDKKEAKEEIYDFLRKEMNINEKYIDESYYDVWRVYIKFDTFKESIMVSFYDDKIKYFIVSSLSKICETNYDEIDKIKNNLKDMVTALEMIGRLN